MKHHLGVGSACWYKGKQYNIVGQFDVKKLVLYRDDLPAALTVHKCLVEPLIWDVFALGDRVNSPRNFYGTVTAFETLTNRVVCLSEKEDCRTGGRVRYSYGVDEIVHSPKEEPVELF